MNNQTLITILEHTRPAIWEAVQWMENHLGKNERLEICQWTGSLFYVEVIDNRKEKFKCVQRFGLTVDLATDSIFWNDMSRYDTTGNCFVRSPKWKGLARVKNAGSNRIHFYKDWI